MKSTVVGLRIDSREPSSTMRIPNSRYCCFQHSLLFAYLYTNLASNSRYCKNRMQIFFVASFCFFLKKHLLKWIKQNVKWEKRN